MRSGERVRTKPPKRTRHTSPLKNAEAFNWGKIADFSAVGAKAVDDRTLHLELERPTAYLPALAANRTGMPVQRGTLERLGVVAMRATKRRVHLFHA